MPHARNLPLIALVVAIVLAIVSHGSSAQELADEFVALSRLEDVSSEEWFALAQRAREAGDIETAGRALDNATEIPGVRVMLERARIETRAGNADAAIEILQTASDNGFAAVRLITGDTVLGALEGNKRFDALIDTMNRAAFPCLYDERFAEFDFWLGEWDVHGAGGQYAGSNVIRREESGCVLTEHWTGASGSTGSSVNFVDKTTGEWVQVWNSENGAQISIRGGLTEEGMLMTGHLHTVATGTTTDFRGLWTLLDDGRVRQFFEQSNDGGLTWSPWFEGFYTRRTDAEGIP